MSKDLFKNVGQPTTADNKQEAPVTEPVVEPVKEYEKPSEPVTEPVTAPSEEAPALNSSGSTQEAPAEPVEEDEDETDPDAPQVDELTFLKQRADLMGITYSNNIGVEALRKKITDKTEADNASSDDETEVEDEPEVKEDLEEAPSTIVPNKDHPNVTGLDPNEAAVSKPRKPNKKMSARTHVMREKMKLVRLRITNLDPKKANVPGEILTVANEYIGTVRKYVPFGEQTDNGYHVPYCIYEMLRDRKFLNIRTRKGKFNTPIVEQSWAKEFALEVLPPLTAEELAKLSITQQAAGYGLED